LALLQPVYDRFTEGFETADLKTAKALLDALQEVGAGVASAAPRSRPSLEKLKFPDDAI